MAKVRLEKIASAIIPVKPVKKPVSKPKVVKATVTPANTLGSIKIGTKFRYAGTVYQKLNEAATGVVITGLVADGDAVPITLPRDTRIELLPVRVIDSDSMD